MDAVKFVPAGADDAEETWMVAGVPAVKASCPDAIACFTLLSAQRVFTITWEAGISSTGTPGMSPFLKASPVVNGTVAVVPEVS